MTIRFCTDFQKPFMMVNPLLRNTLQKINFLKWLAYNKINILNVAGPRESNAPGIREETIHWLEYVFEEKSEA